MENSDHFRAKQQIKDELERQGWDAYTEKRIDLRKPSERYRYESEYIFVDVFAVKDNKFYVCELGQVSGENRIKFLENVFDFVDHFPLNRDPYRIINQKDWSVFNYVRVDNDSGYSIVKSSI